MKDILDCTKLKFSYIISIVLIICLTSGFIFPGIAEACSCVYAGKDVTADAKSIIARSSDSHPPNSIAVVDKHPRVENQPGRVLEATTNNFKYNFPDTTYEYFTTPSDSTLEEGIYGAVATNEYGLCCSGTVTCYSSPEIYKADPLNPDTGFLEELFADVVCSSCKTAREAVELIGSIIDENGVRKVHSVLIADQQETWLMEWYSGHQWGALKLPNDKMCAFGNQFMVQTEYVGLDADSFIHSANLFTMPTNAGLAVMNGGNMSLAETYSGKDRLWDYANLRTYMLHRYFSPSTAGNYDTYKRYDLFFTPDEKISLDKMFNAFRYRYEGTEYCPDENGSETTRVVGSETQITVHVVQIDSQAPQQLAETAWVTNTASEHSVFLPYSNIVSKFNKYYTDTSKWDSDDKDYLKEQNPKGSLKWYNQKSAPVCFERLAALAEQNRDVYGAGVRTFWHDKELKLIKEYDEVYKHALELYEKSPQEAENYMNDWLVNLQISTLAECNSMYDELTWFVAEHNDTMKFEYTYDTLTLGPDRNTTKETFTPQMVFYDKYLQQYNDEENSFYFKINKIGLYVGAAALVIAIISALTIFIIKKRKTNRD